MSYPYPPTAPFMISSSLSLFFYILLHIIFFAFSLLLTHPHPLSVGDRMKSNRKTRFSSSSSTVTYTFRNDNSTPPHLKEIPIKSPHPPPIPITVHLHHHQSLAAARIQAAYRSHVVRTLVRKISAVKSEADKMERLIQRQETVDLMRSSEKEKVRINEALMGLLLDLDSVPGFDPTVRELRRRASRRIVGLQEVMDGICGSESIGVEMDDWDGFWNWDEMMGEMEGQVCRERGGEELERFCELNLGFRCLQRFLRDG